MALFQYSVSVSALSHFLCVICVLCVIWALLPEINLRSFVRSRCKNWTSYVMVHSVIGCNLGCRCDEYRNTQVRSSPTTQLATAHVREHCIYFSWVVQLTSKLYVMTDVWWLITSATASGGADSIGHGGTCPSLLQMARHRAGERTVSIEQQTRNWPNCTDHHKSAHQND